MHYYEVFVASQNYHGSDALTYCHDELFDTGTVVHVPMGAKMVAGFISKAVAKPSFATKRISSSIGSYVLPEQLITLHGWMREYYPGPSGILTQLFVPSTLKYKQVEPAEPTSKTPLALPDLTGDQLAASQTINAKVGPYLLHGDTGTGKTRLYIELSQKALDTNKSVIMLTPEIGLTTQLMATLEQSFPGRVVVMHSTQTPAQRLVGWSRIAQSTEPLIIIGPRSALFTPIRSVGLIILDESHDGAYKQEQMPYYQTSRVAGKLAQIHGATLVLGSATPLITDYFTFKEKALPIVRMTTLASGPQKKLKKSVVDLKNRASFSKSSWLSDELITAVKEALHEGNQALVFLNRRGTARLVLCKTCGWYAACPRCDLPLTYHGDKHELRCHTCGYIAPTPSICQSCSSTEIQFKSVGTKTIVDELHKLFPQARIARFDGDNSKDERLESQYKKLRSGEIDIAVGTQMITKGLDLPKLSAVGIVTADTNLFFPDYTSEERTFQALRQVIGRVGRGHVDGKIVVQTYFPESKTMQFALNNDYASFYDQEINERLTYKFPPFYFVLKLSVERANNVSASKAAHELASDILRQHSKIELVGPTPAFIERVNKKYRWQIVIKAKDRSVLTKVVRSLPKNCRYDLDPSNLL